jgi:hypothetical protein
VLLVEDVLLRRGEWTSGDLDAFVAFGAPGLPRAVDARLYAAATDDEDAPTDTTPFEPVPIERAFRRPLNARLLFGSGAMAGAVLHLRDSAFRHATAATGVARVRVRTLIDLPAPDSRTGREVVIRLGAHDGEPFALDAIEVTSDDPRPWLTGAEAHLCGPDADPWPLAVHLQPTPKADARGALPAQRSPIAPVLSVRHASDDLCVRFWTTSDTPRVTPPS